MAVRAGQGPPGGGARRVGSAPGGAGPAQGAGYGGACAGLCVGESC